jgi:hypothetical protein
MAEVFCYFELWSRLEAEGGTRLGFIGPESVANVTRRRRVGGDDALSFGLLKTHRVASSIDKGKAIREVLSLDGTSVREWVVDRYTWGSGPRLFLSIECLSPMVRLTQYPVSTTDADGFVSSDTAAVLLSPATILTNFIRSNTPAWIGTGTVTPTALAEIPFSGDSSQSGLRRMEELIPGYDAGFRRNGASQYLIDFLALGASAPILYLRTAKNLKSLVKEVVSGQVTRVNQFAGADGDDGPSGIAWAYWEVDSTSGAGPFLVKLKAIHGGPGPIKYDNQFNHANLPSGANSLYLEKRDGTFIQITGSTASTQEITVSSLTTITAGDRVRIVASSTGKHLTFLDAPTELAAYGVFGGRYESAWDDVVCVLKNALQSAWAGTLPDSWTGLGAKTTTANEWLTSGQALLINQSVGDGVQIAAPAVQSWFITKRRAIWSAVAWIRLRALTSAGDITFRVKVGSTVIGAGLLYVSPANVWVQLKIEGMDLSAYINSTVSLTAEIIKSNGVGTVNMIVDSICPFPAISARAVTEGSNAARIWQGANQYLDDQRALQVSYKVDLVDLARMGLVNQTDLTLGGSVVIADDELAAPVTARLMEIEDDPTDVLDTRVVIATLPARLSRQQSKPLALIIPYSEPIHRVVADRDTRNAAMFLKASVTGSDATSVTYTLTVLDTLGGTPVISYNVFGAAYSSGSGTGPWVFTRPGVGAGVGRVVWTAKLAGRNDVTDSADIAEVDPATLPQMVAKAVTQSSDWKTLVVRVTAATGTGGVTVTSNWEAGAITVSPATGGTLTSVAAINDTPGVGSYIDYTITRAAFQAGSGHVVFKLTASGYRGATVSVDVADVDRDTVTLQIRARTIAQTATTVTVRVAGVDPFPQGANTLSLAHQSQGVTSVDLTSPQTITPEATFSEAANTYKDYVVTRAAAGGGTGRVTWTGTATGRIAASDSADAPCQDPVIPPRFSSLTSVATSDTTWTVTWAVSSGTVEISKNNGAWTAPASLSPAVTSGTAFTRPGTDDEYAFRVTDGVIVSGGVVKVLAKIYVPSLTGVNSFFNSGTSVDTYFTASGMPTGVKYDLFWQAYNSSHVATGASGSSVDGTATTYNWDPAPDAVSTDRWRIQVSAKFGGVVLTTANVYTTMLT